MCDLCFIERHLFYVIKTNPEINKTFITSKINPPEGTQPSQQHGAYSREMMGGNQPNKCKHTCY